MPASYDTVWTFQKFVGWNGSPVSVAFHFTGVTEVVETVIVAQYWLDARELRLVVYREREGAQPHGYVEVTILAKAAGDEGKYKGTFALTAYDTAGDRERTHKAGGRVSCFVE